MKVESFMVYECYEGDSNGNTREIKAFRDSDKARDFCDALQVKTGNPCFVEWQLHLISRNGREILEAETLRWKPISRIFHLTPHST